MYSVEETARETVAETETVRQCRARPEQAGGRKMGGRVLWRSREGGNTGE